MHTWCQYNVRTAVKENKCIKCVRKHKWVATLSRVYLPTCHLCAIGTRTTWYRYTYSLDLKFLPASS